MICTDEVFATLNRLNIIKSDSDDPREQLGSEILIKNLNAVMNQLKPVFESKEFEDEAKRLENESSH